MVGENIFNAVYYDEYCDGNGYRVYNVSIDEAIAFVGNSDECFIETSCLETTVYEDKEWIFSKERSEQIAKEEWERYIEENPESPEAQLGVGK